MRTRRDFFRAALLAAGTASVTEAAHAASGKIPSVDRMGILIDTTGCVGCRSCETACRAAHDLSGEPVHAAPDTSVAQVRRRPGNGSLTVINQYPGREEPGHPTYVKVQCMHCDYPACESACIVGAIAKKENGPVVWDSDKCIGCRYCMVACPFQIPSFEYEEALKPDIVKCDFCFERITAGGLPACVEICPMEVLTYGRRSALIEMAREKIRHYPERYEHHVYGEFEAGGTSFLYLANAGFKELEFPDLGRDPMPGTSESIQHGIFAYFVPPVSLYALLGGLMWIAKRSKETEKEMAE